MSRVKPVCNGNDSMSTQNQQIRIDELSENLGWAKLIFEWISIWFGFGVYMHPNTRPICELYFQYTRVLIFLLMRFLSIFYRIEQCARVCVQVRLFSISFVRLDRLVFFFFSVHSFILHLSTLEYTIHSMVYICGICMGVQVCDTVSWVYSVCRCRFMYVNELSLLLPFFGIGCLPLFLFFIAVVVIVVFFFFSWPCAACRECVVRSAIFMYENWFTLNGYQPESFCGCVYL